MKILLILSANLCIVACLAQTKATTKKDYSNINDKENNTILIKEDSLNIRNKNTLSKIPNQRYQKNNKIDDYIDPNSDSKIINANTQKK